MPVHLLERLDLGQPFWTYRAMFGSRYGFLLDSASSSGEVGLHSFLGADPFLVLKAKRHPSARGGYPARLEVLDPRSGSSVVRHVEGDLFGAIRSIFDAHGVSGDAYASRPVPFLAGAVGYFGYEAGHLVESLPDTGADDIGLPDVYLMFFDTVLAYCHRTRAAYLSVLGRGPHASAARARAEEERDAMLRRIADFERAPPVRAARPSASHGPAAGEPRIEAMFDERRYAALVDACKDRIFAGDAFEICLTHRLRAAFHGDPWDLYRELRRINPAPFACYLDLPEARVVSSSPERFLRLGADRVAESRPMKGTRPRGETPRRDQELFDELATSVKDQAENNMIVDLVRNDFGRVCRLGSVEVPELRVVERHATVHQMVSTIRGVLDDGRDGIDLLRACFPGGSMTGAPKIEAMKILDRLEPVKRGVYSGAIGYMDFSGPMDFNIVIRSFVVKGDQAYFNVGGAVTADSDPRAEHRETMDKARALVEALRSTHAARA